MFFHPAVILLAVLTLAPGRDQTSRAETGRRLYERAKCATCHQIAKRGNSRYPLDGVAARLAARDLRRWLTEPDRMEAALPSMPALRMSTMKYRFDEAELDALVAYLQTLK
jgi:mono/diheme cytochrome c family protein